MVISCSESRSLIYHVILYGCLILNDNGKVVLLICLEIRLLEKEMKKRSLKSVTIRRESGRFPFDILLFVDSFFDDPLKFINLKPRSLLL